jgi:hypothetical protein
MILKRYFFLLIIFFISINCKGQTKQPLIFDTSEETTVASKDTVINEIGTSDMKIETETFYFLSQKEFWLAIVILVLLLTVLIIEAWMIKSRKFTDDSAIKLVLITIVLFGVLFLFVSGYSDKQIAPVFGLFGTICGYLFGKMNNDSPKTIENENV